MSQYLISFNDGAMDHIPAEDWPDVGKAAHAVVQEAVNAGVWVYGGGLERQRASIVATDGMITDGPYPETKEVIAAQWVRSTARVATKVTTRPATPPEFSRRESATARSRG
jgi:hypothetical protein